MERRGKDEIEDGKTGIQKRSRKERTVRKEKRVLYADTVRNRGQVT
jgi:hypothetical protein